MHFNFIFYKLVDLGIFASWEFPYPKIHVPLSFMIDQTHLTRVLSKNSVQICTITAKKLFRSTLLLARKGWHIVSFYFLTPSTFIRYLIFKSYLHFLVIIEQNYSPRSKFISCSKFWVLTLGGIEPHYYKSNFQVDVN